MPRPYCQIHVVIPHPTKMPSKGKVKQAITDVFATEWSVEGLDAHCEDNETTLKKTLPFLCGQYDGWEIDSDGGFLTTGKFAPLAFYLFYSTDTTKDEIPSLVPQMIRTMKKKWKMDYEFYIDHLGRAGIRPVGLQTRRHSPDDDVQTYVPLDFKPSPNAKTIFSLFVPCM